MRLTIQFLLVALVLSTTAIAQDAKVDATVVETKRVASDFDTLDAKMKSLEQRLDAIREEFGDEKTTDEQKEALKKEFGEKRDELIALFPSLREAAINDYKANPNKNEKVTNILLRYAMSELSVDQYVNAYEITSLLLANKTTNNDVYDFAARAAFGINKFSESIAMFEKAEKLGNLSRESRALLRGVDNLKSIDADWKKEMEIRKAEAKADDLPRVKFETSEGDIVIELLENEAPIAVANFVSLVDSKFYDGLVFHRVLPQFMAQGGCPLGKGIGGPGYKIPCECYEPNHRLHFAGSLSMAHAGKDTGGSQFFLTFIPTTHLNGKHTVFGYVKEGLDVIGKLKKVDPRAPSEPSKIVKATVLRKRDHEYKPTKVK